MQQDAATRVCICRMTSSRSRAGARSKSASICTENGNAAALQADQILWILPPDGKDTPIAPPSTERGHLIHAHAPGHPKQMCRAHDEPAPSAAREKIWDYVGLRRYLVVRTTRPGGASAIGTSHTRMAKWGGTHATVALRADLLPKLQPRFAPPLLLAVLGIVVFVVQEHSSCLEVALPFGLREERCRVTMLRPLVRL